MPVAVAKVHVSDLNGQQACHVFDVGKREWHAQQVRLPGRRRQLLPFLAINGEIFPGSQLLQLRVLRLGLLHDGMSGSASFHSVEEVLVGDAGLDLLALGGEHPCLVQTGHRDEGVAWTLVAKVDDPLELGRGRP